MNDKKVLLFSFLHPFADCLLAELGMLSISLCMLYYERFLQYYPVIIIIIAINMLKANIQSSSVDLLDILATHVQQCWFIITL